MLFAAIQGFLQCFSFSKGHLKGKVFLEACVFLKYQEIRLGFYQDVCIFLIASAENSTMLEDGGILFSPYFELELGFRSWIKWCKNSYFFEKNQIFAFKGKGLRFLLSILKLIFMLIQAWEQSGRPDKVKFACNIKEKYTNDFKDNTPCDSSTGWKCEVPPPFLLSEAVVLPE